MAEPLIARLGAMALKSETTKGTWNAPGTDTTDAKFRVFDLAWQDDMRKFDRRTYAKTLSRYPHLVGMRLAQVTGWVELRKTNTTNTEDQWGLLMRSGGFSFSTGVYTLSTDSSTHKTLSGYFWCASNGAASSSIRRGLRGIATHVKLSGKVGEPMRLDFTMYGVHDVLTTSAMSAVDATMPTITHEVNVPGVFNAVSSLTWGGTSDVLKMSSFEVDFGTQVVERHNAAYGEGVEHFCITDRDVTITIDPEVPLAATENYHAKLHSGVETALLLTHNQLSMTTPANNAATFAFSFPKCQIESVQDGERNGIKTYGLTLKPDLNAEPGDDEFSLTITKSA